MNAEELKNKYESGTKVADLAKEYNVTEWQIRKLLKEAGTNFQKGNRVKPKIFNLDGQKIGKLLVKETVMIEGKCHSVCLCDCGQECTIYSLKLTNGERTSCGCKKAKADQLYPASKSYKIFEERDKFKEKSVAGVIWSHQYKDGNLEFDDFWRLCQSNCHYCGAKPSNNSSQYGTNLNYHGLRKIDSGLPHNLDNVVTACRECKIAQRKV